LSIDVEALKAEREMLKERLREVENEQRQVEGQQKKLRQKEIQTKRTIEALDTLIDINAAPVEAPDPSST
jgi:predicted  nucleic acid-binding Zn-ribbon protein